MKINFEEALLISGYAEESSCEFDKGRNIDNNDKSYMFENSETRVPDKTSTEQNLDDMHNAIEVPIYDTCVQCDKIFPTRFKLMRHMKTHIKEKSYVCSKCPAGFREKRYLINHGTSHIKEKPFKCSQCEKYFKVMKHLKIHVKTHSGEKPFKCIECERCFTAKKNH